MILDADAQTITCKAHVKYGEREFSLAQKDKRKPENSQVEVFRDLPKEKETVFILQQWFPELDEQNDWFHCGKDEDAIYNVISEGVEQLLLMGEVQSTERFRNMNLARKTKLSVGVSVSNGLLELDIASEDISREELLDVLKSYRMKRKYHRLKNGDFLSVQEESIEMLSEMMESLHITPKEFVKGNMKIPAYRGLYLEKLLEEHEEIYSSRDSHFRSLVKEFKTVKVIQSKTRFALTGTPIENRLSELWSIFDYLMPGFLYGYDVFKRELETPIVKYQEENAVSRLQKMVAPFILRRLKSDVLKDLPEKLEEVKYAHLEEQQRTLYDAQVVYMQQTIQAQDASEFQKNKLQVLAELTRLRQICCDPSLCFEQYKGESAKRETCLELVESAIEGGHKILLFSQFTSMLEILQGDPQKERLHTTRSRVQRQRNNGSSL